MHWRFGGAVGGPREVPPRAWLRRGPTLVVSGGCAFLWVGVCVRVESWVVGCISGVSVAVPV